MANEKKTDLFISRLLDKAKITYSPNGSDIKEIHEALKTASKRKTNKVGFPEFVGISKDFILVIEDKPNVEEQAKYNDNGLLSENVEDICKYAENGALHYARHIVNNTNFKKVFAFGCSGDDKHHIIRPIYVEASSHKILPEIDNFKNFSEDSIAKYFKEQVLGELSQEVLELEEILKKSSVLNEDLRNYGQLGDQEKPLVVSAILLALCEETFSIDNLKGDNIKTDGQVIFDAISTYLKRAEILPEAKKQVILDQFNIVKNRANLNKLHKFNDNSTDNKNEKKLWKTPLKHYAEYLKKNVLSSVVANSPEDVLGRFYGEFIRYTGGDGQTLGVVLTPRHITELFCELVDIQPTDIIFDPCCGTGGFLVAGMHHMLKKAETVEERTIIKKDRVYGIEVREDMFSVATTNMILRGDGKSNLIREDFLAQNADQLKTKKFSVGFMNPPYSQAKNIETQHLSELSFIKHLLDSLNDNGRCVVIVPQSTMVGKTAYDRQIKKEILKKHTLEGVITLNTNTFYRVGTNACLAIFTAHKPHEAKKRCKFINFKDDGFTINKHIGLVKTERAEEKREKLLDCWLNGADAESKFMVKSTIEADDEWLHSFYYFNDEIPKEADFEKTIANYLTFEFSMIMQDRGYLFEGAPDE